MTEYGVKELELYKWEDGYKTAYQGVSENAQGPFDLDEAYDVVMENIARFKQRTHGEAEQALQAAYFAFTKFSKEEENEVE